MTLLQRHQLTIAAAGLAIAEADESGPGSSADAARSRDASAATRDGQAFEPLSEADRAALAVAAIGKDVERLDRYERRALSCRKMAARRLGQHRRRSP